MGGRDVPNRQSSFHRPIGHADEKIYSVRALISFTRHANPERSRRASGGIIASRGAPLISFTRRYDDCMYGATLRRRAFPTARTRRRPGELNRRLKLDLLITAGNARSDGGQRPRYASYLIKPSFRNSHADICHRCNQRTAAARLPVYE